MEQEITAKRIVRWVNLCQMYEKRRIACSMMIEISGAFRQGDDTIPARLELLREQMIVLEEQKRAVEETVKEAVVQD